MEELCKTKPNKNNLNYDKTFIIKFSLFLIIILYLLVFVMYLGF